MKLIPLLLFAPLALAQIEAPKIGTMLDRDGVARTVFGIAGNFALGSNETYKVLAVSCARENCLYKTDSAIVSSTGSVDAPAGTAIFGLGGLVFFPETRQLARWQADRLTFIDFDVSGDILAVGDGVFAVRRRSGVWVVADGDRSIQALPRSTRAVILLADGVLFATDHLLILRRANAPELTWHIDGVESLSWLGENYVQAGSFALRFDAGHEGLWQLPETPR